MLKSMVAHTFWERYDVPAGCWPPEFGAIPSALLELHVGDQPMGWVNR
jgi:hypothetical protein